MNILSDEEKKALYDAADPNPYCWLDGKVFADMIEAAVVSKLAEQAGEPVAYRHRDGVFSCRLPGGCVVGIDWTPLYTEAQLIAAQQRTAEACAKVCASNSEEAMYWCSEAVPGRAFAESIRNEEWMKYR